LLMIWVPLLAELPHSDTRRRSDESNTTTS
jgi:hypothetical protein